jgi:dTDP-4-amino-4,6-dideoxygalactose transaminase
MVTIEEPVPVYRPYLGSEIQDAVRDALETGWLGMGSLSQAFEVGLERYLGLDGDPAAAWATEARVLIERLAE